MKLSNLHFLITLAVGTLLSACSGGSSSLNGGNPPPPPPVVPMSAAGIWVGTAVTPDVADITTSFEFSDSNGFILGNTPFTADFQGGETKSVGNAGLYSEGDFSWHVDTADGSVTFATPGDSLLLSTRTVSADDNATINVLDEFGAPLSSTVVPDNNFLQISVNTNPGQPRIGSVVITVNTGEIVIDSFTIGFPSTASTDDIACLLAPDPNNDFTCVITDTTTGDLRAGANGAYTVNGDQVSGTGYVYAAPGETLVDGSSTIATLTIGVGTVVESNALDLTIDSSGLGIAVTSLFDATYDRGANLATVAAVYSMFDIFGVMSSFAIDANGVISGQTTTGCVLSGQVSVIDAAANTYAVNLVADAATCGALAGDYNGLGSSQDDTVMDDAFIFAAFVNGQLMTVGEAIK